MSTNTSEQGFWRQRQFQGRPGQVITFVLAAITLYHLLYAADVFEYLKIYLFGAHRGMSYAMVLLMTFLLVPATRKAPLNKLPWYDVLLAILGLLPTLYFFFFYNSLLGKAYPSMLEQVLAGLIMLLSLEAARRTMGWPLVLLGGFFIFYSMQAEIFPSFLHAKNYSYARMAFYLFMSPQGMFGVVMEIFSTIIIVYLAFARFIQDSGAGEFFLNLGFSMLGHMRGGPAKGAVVSSALFGTISGVAVANVTTTGTFTIPMMKKAGYPAHFAAGVEATASSGGVIMPPVMGAVIFVMAEVLDISYWTIAMAAFIPAFLYYLGIYWQVDFRAATAGLKGLPRAELPRLGETLRKGWYYLLPIAVLVYVMGVLGYTPVKAGLYALISVVIINCFRKGSRPTFSNVTKSLSGASANFLQIAPVAGVVGIMMGAVGLTGLGARLSAGLVDLAQGNLLVLLLLAAATPYILGMGLDVITIYVVLSIFVAPAMVNMGVFPLAAHLFIVYWAVTSFITPPVCVATYAAAAIAGSSIFKSGFQAMRLGIVAFLVPFFFVYNPALLLKGSIQEILWVTFTSIIGVIALSAALEGYLLRKCSLWERLLLGAGGLMLMIPERITDFVGAGMVVAVFGLQLSQHLAQRRAAISLKSVNPQENLEPEIRKEL